MRTKDEWLCDTPTILGCERLAHPTEIKLCGVEGSEIALCRNCGKRWREETLRDPRIARHCPRCAPGYLASLSLLVASGASEARPVTPPPPDTTGSMYYAVERAMFTEGILVDVRQRVLERLARDDKFSHFARVADIVVSMDEVSA